MRGWAACGVFRLERKHAARKTPCTCNPFCRHRDGSWYGVLASHRPAAPPPLFPNAQRITRRTRIGFILTSVATQSRDGHAELATRDIYARTLIKYSCFFSDGNTHHARRVCVPCGEKARSETMKKHSIYSLTISCTLLEETYSSDLCWRRKQPAHEG